ncbi:hypothetical protein WDW86_12465 [Bdellovibrionota bacterium FG-2]
MLMEKNWRDLIKPKALDVDKESLTKTYGKFVARPLERGFGLTLGNSLRRVLLSSLQGAAITAIKVDGVVHEFTSIPDVKEDVAEIILNLKEVRFSLFADQSTILIDKVGPGEVRASDIIVSEQVKVLNPDHLIATLGKGAKLRFGFQLQKKYVVAAFSSSSPPLVRTPNICVGSEIDSSEKASSPPKQHRYGVRVSTQDPVPWDKAEIGATFQRPCNFPENGFAPFLADSPLSENG